MTIIGSRYQIETLLGRGGMGVVYRATDMRTGQAVAIKQLRREVAQRRPDMVERFAREAEALRQLDHPNMVKALDTLEHNDERYIVMEYVAGRTLHDMLDEEGALPVQRVAQIAIELADALTRAHYLEIVHRDIKPANVMIEPNGTSRLTDFGIAYLQNRDRVTITRVQLGTPDYMAPEALEGKPVDARSDIWALGIVMWEMLTGVHPWQANALPAMLNNIFSKPLPDLEQIRPDVPVGLVDLIYRMLAKDPNARIPSVRLVGAELEMVLNTLKHGASETPTLSPARLRAPEPTRFETPESQIETVTNNLGGQTTAFVGRASELGDLYRLLDDPATRLITVMGPGGMGKTRLMLELGQTVVEGRVPGTQARRRETGFNDGVFLIALQPLTGADAIPHAIADAVGFQFYPGTPHMQQLLDYFREKAVLLLVDNCEHLAEGLMVFSEILHAAPDAKIVATSRAKLGLQGETLFSIDGMDYPSAGTVEDALRYGGVQLFIQSARRVQPRFELSLGDVEAVARICALVRGMPLGIELAAGWAELLSPREIADEVARSLDFLESNTGTLNRQRSVRAVFESSWGLLTAEERTAFTRIAVFRGSFARAAGQAVTGTGLRPLMGLVNKSFLQRDPDSGRYIAHELMRQFAEERLLESGEADAVYQAHSAHFLVATADALPAIQSAGQPEAFTAIDYDFENIRAALTWAARHGHADLLRRAAHPLGIYFDLRALYAEGLAVFSAVAEDFRAATESGPARDDTLASLLCWAGFYVVYFRHNEVALPLISEGIALVRADSDGEVRAQTQMTFGYYHMLLGDIPTARSAFAQASEIFTEMKRFWDAAHTQMNWGTSYWYRAQGDLLDFDMARKLTLDALKLTQRIGERHLEAYCYFSLGRIESLLRNYETAADYAHRAMPLFRAARNLFAYGNALFTLAANGVVRGRVDEARVLIRENIAINRQRGHNFYTAQGLLVEARLELWEGNWAESRQLAEEALLLTEKTGNGDFVHTARIAIARVDLVAMDYEEALKTLLITLDIARAKNQPLQVSQTYHELSLAYYCLADLDMAFRSSYEALAVAEIVGSQSHIATGHFSIGRMAFFTKDYATARPHFDAALAFLRDDAAQQSINGWDDGYRYQMMYSVLADYAEMELAEGSPDAARALLKEALFQAERWNNIPGQLDGISFASELLLKLGEPEEAVSMAVFVREQPRAYAYNRSVASAFLRRLRQSGALPDFETIVNRPSTLQLGAVVRSLMNRL